MIVSTLRKFWTYYRPYQRLFWADMACAFVVAATTLALPLGANYMIKRLLPGAGPGNLGQIFALGALLLGLVAVNTACSLVVDYYGHMMGAHIESDMRRELLEHYQRLSFGFYDNQRTGQLMARLTHDLFAISEFFHHAPEDLAIAVLKLLGVLVILATLNGPLTLLLGGLLLVMTVYALYFHRRMQAAMRLSRDRMADINAQVEDTLAGIRVVKSFTNEAIEQRKFAEVNQRFIATRRAEYRGDAAFSAGTTAFTQLLTIAVIVFGGVAIARAGMDLADLLTYLLCVGILIEPIQRLVNVARVYQEGMTGFERFQAMMAIAPAIQDAPGARALALVRGRIEFHAVSFRYKDDHDYVLKNLSLDINAGEYVALVGSSGVGKTTLCSLIPRFYEASAGQILIDDQNIKDLTLRSLRQNIGIVQQDVYLFAGTVADNIRYGKMDASDAEIVAAARQANAHAFIMALPDGYNTDIGQRGVKLSGGQKQRLSIARVFLKDPPIIIFDEATSALDNETERAVRDSLERLSNNRTTLVIAHRLSTVRNAQRIVVLTDSGIEEQGTHDELLALAGAYANVYNLQMVVQGTAQSKRAIRMELANNANEDYKALVRRSYDACAAAYEAARQAEANPELDLIIQRLPSGARVLDIGCGAGVPVAATLARHARVTGVDISPEQIRRARANVPGGTFIEADIMALDFAPASFDAAVAYYSLFHLPREEHAAFFRRLHHWLKPAGQALITVAGRAEAAYTEDDFFGVQMYWSNWSVDEYRIMLAGAGFAVIGSGSVGHGYVEATGAAEEWHPYLLVIREDDMDLA